MPPENSLLQAHYRTLMELAKSELSGTDLAASLREITEAAVRTLNTARANVWLYDESRTRIVCIDHYERATGEHSRGQELTAADYPNYFRALKEERTLVADDAMHDPRTREFAHGYLDTHGITSMMDTPLHSRGAVVGVVCSEHIGPPRTWTLEEQQLAGSLADMATIALESSERRRAERALRRSERRTRAIITHALDAIVTADENSVITDWNPQAEEIFGWTREEALGMTLFETVIPLEQIDRHRSGMRRFLDTGVKTILNTRVETTARDKHGREFPVELAVVPVSSPALSEEDPEGRSEQGGVGWEFSAFIRDITERVEADRRIRELNARLKKRIHARTDELKTAMIHKERLMGVLASWAVRRRRSE